MEKEDLSQGQSNSLLIELVKGVSLLTAKFDSFEKVRSEDNMELKESIEKVDRKVDGLDIKLQKMKENYDAKIGDLQKAPLKDKAQKWESVTKLIFEGIISACLVVILIKIGLK